MPKIVAEGRRWLAEIDGPCPRTSLFTYRFRARSSTAWTEAGAGSLNEAITSLVSRLGDQRLLAPDEMVQWTNAAE